MKTIRFSMCDEEHRLLTIDANAKGLTIAQYAKMATFSYASKYASKGVMVEIAALREKTP